MVYNITRQAKLPFSNARVHHMTGRLISSGSGIGSVLLRTGGGGSASSYSDIDDYIHTTGINPYERPGRPKYNRGTREPTGMGFKSLTPTGFKSLTPTGLKSLTNKLEKLSVGGAPRKKITMSF
jgi:hypothetical protein